MMISDLSERVHELRARNLTTSQIANILTARGTTITSDEVLFVCKWRKFAAQLEHNRARVAARNAARARKRQREQRILKQRRLRAEERLAALNKRASDVKMYERFGCTIDAMGRVRLPKMEST